MSKTIQNQTEKIVKLINIIYFIKKNDYGKYLKKQ